MKELNIRANRDHNFYLVINKKKSPFVIKINNFFFINILNNKQKK